MDDRWVVKWFEWWVVQLVKKYAGSLYKLHPKLSIEDKYRHCLVELTNKLTNKLTY